MVKSSSLTTALAAILLALTAGCSSDQSQDASTSPSPTLSTSRAPAPSLVKSKAPSPSASPRENAFNDAMDAAASAATIAQSAQSRDDWDLVASRWKEAIGLMKTVPNNSKNYATAQKKLAEYQTNLAYAAKKAGLPSKAASLKSSPPAGTQPKSTPKASPASSPK